MLKAPLAYTIMFGALVGAAVIAAPARAQDDAAGRAQLCAACHGAEGKPVSGIMPIIWGQQSNFLYKELHDYHSGQRYNATMTPLIKTLALADLRKLGDYFGAKTWPAQQTNIAASATPPYATMCKACHGQNFEGTPAAPRLAGQNYEYLLSALDGFASGERTNNLDMPGFVKVLSEDQRQQIAHYLSAL